jgi:peptidoglycan/xylan/chitin deacetylase (PgdA/CDA1 family)
MLVLGGGLTASGCSLGSSAASAYGRWALVRSPGAELRHSYSAAIQRQVREVVTAANGSEARLALLRGKPVDLKNNVLRFWVRVPSQTARSVATITVKLGSGPTPFGSFSYQEIVVPDGGSGYLLSTVKPDVWTPITIGPPSMVGVGDGVVDYTAVQDLEIAATAVRGVRASLQFGGVDVVKRSRAFPHGVVSITFDDGLASPFRLAYPLLARHGFPATAYVIRQALGTALYMTRAQAHQLHGAGWEIAAHANLLANHNARIGMVGLPAGRALRDWRTQRQWLLHSGFGGADFAYPKGYFDPSLLAELRHFGHFATARSCDFRSVETLPVANPLALRCHLYDHTVQVGPSSRPGTILWRIDQVRRYGGWLILGFHDLVSSTGNGRAIPVVNEGSAITVPQFTEIVNHLAAVKIPVRTVDQVRRAAGIA